MGFDFQYLFIKQNIVLHLLSREKNIKFNIKSISIMKNIGLILIELRYYF